MKSLLMTAVMAAAPAISGTSVLADEADASLSRAEVIAELDAAQAAGTIAAFVGEDSGAHYLGQQRWTSKRSRADVVAEMVDARRSGLMAAMVGEDSGDAYLAQHGAQQATQYAGPNTGAGEDTPSQVATAADRAHG